MHAVCVETACIMFDVDTGYYLKAFDCPMRFALHERTQMLCKTTVTALLSDFYFRSQAVPKLYIHYFSYTLYL